jgi:hypothetical protein
MKLTEVRRCHKFGEKVATRGTASVIECPLHVVSQLPRCRLNVGDLIWCETEADKARRVTDELCE